MKTLLKDLPEHKERIENNHHLLNDVKEFVINSKKDHAADPLKYAERILSAVTDFVNENYEWKGIKA